MLQPVIRVAAGTALDKVRVLAHQAHNECYIANSLNSEVELHLRIVES